MEVSVHLKMVFQDSANEVYSWYMYNKMLALIGLLNVCQSSWWWCQKPIMLSSQLTINLVIVFLQLSIDYIYIFLFINTSHRKELLDLQGLYKESIDHAAQQAELIQQLQALNLETQKVMRNQEDAYASETKTYQKVSGNITVSKVNF